jgi:hypothetical protein
MQKMLGKETDFFGHGSPHGRPAGGRRGEPISDQACTAAAKGAAIRLQLSLGIGLVLLDASCEHDDNP